MQRYNILLTNEISTFNLGQELARSSNHPILIYLYGDLGIGKTTLTRGFLYECGYIGNINSPSYTLVEEYKTDLYMIYHFDFYRVSTVEELEYIGIRDYFQKQSYYLVEWPEHGIGFLPSPDISVTLRYIYSQREAEIVAISNKGIALLKTLREIRK